MEGELDPRAVRDAIGRLNREVNDLEEGAETASRRLDELEGEVEAHQSRLNETEEHLDDVRGDVAEASGRLDRLFSHMRWLERAVATAGELPVADLDKRDAATRALAGRVAKARRARGQLLDEGRKAVLRLTAARPDQIAEQNAQAVDKAVEKSQGLLNLDPERREHPRRASEFNEAVKKVRATVAEYKEAEQEAQAAQKELDEDAELAERLGPAVMDGEQAQSQLKRRMRARLDKAVADSALLPAWFTNALGHTPPAGQESEWVSTAVDVLAYRVVNGVKDPLSPLGPAPGLTDDAYDEYRDLRRQLRSM